MKKILSIFAISTIFGSLIIGSKAGVACSSTQQLNLNDLKLHDLEYLSQARDENKIFINAKNNYKQIATQIISWYNSFYDDNSKRIALSDFKFNATSLTTNKWAIQIKNGNHSIKDTTNENLLITNTINLANKDNSLNVIITTNDKNVVGTSLRTKVYLNQFVFNNCDANKGLNLVIDNNRAQPLLTPSNVIDFTAGHMYALKKLRIDFDVNHLLGSMQRWNNPQRISNAIIDRINKAFTKRIKQKNLQKIMHLQSKKNVIKNLNKAVFKIYERKAGNPTANPFKQITERTSLANDNDIYLQIKVSTWQYLRTHKYLSLPSTYVYGYLGTTANS